MTIDKKPKQVLLGISVFALLLRTYHIGYPFWDYFASRQTFNLLVVRNYLRQGITLLHPTVDWLVSSDASRSSYFCAEFTLLHALAAIEMHLVPFGDWCTRVIPITFSLAGLWWMYGLTQRILGMRVACFSALAWAVLPFSMFFGRAFMSDVPALSLATGALYAFCMWLETQRPVHFVLFLIAGVLAMLTKPQAAIFGVVAVFLGFVEFRGKLWLRTQLYLAAFVIIVPTALYLHHAAKLSLAGGPPVIGWQMIGRSLHLWLQESVWTEQFHRLFYLVLGPVGFGLTAAGLVLPLKSPRQYLFHIWFLATAVFLFLIPEAIVGWNDYYLLLLVPSFAGLIGIALGNLYEHPRSRMRAILLAVALIISSALSVRPLYRSDELHYQVGAILNHLTTPNDLVVTSAGNSPDPLYFAARRGWDADTYDLSKLEALAASGAKLFAITDPDEILKNRDLLPIIDGHFVRLTEADPAGARLGWIIWSLADGDSHLLASRAEQHTGGVTDFGDKIELSEFSIREIFRWPQSFVITSYWHCVTKIDSNLRVFIHVTAQDGRTVFQQDHWPVDGHLPTSSWKSGDLIRERYLMVLPKDLSPGRYQIRGGWFDPVDGRRLHVVSGRSDGEDRVILAEIFVRPRPHKGWFSTEAR